MLPFYGHASHVPTPRARRPGSPMRRRKAQYGPLALPP